MAKRRANVALSEKFEILENYLAQLEYSQRVAAEQLVISHGWLRNILRNETAFRTETSVLQWACHSWCFLYLNKYCYTIKKTTIYSLPVTVVYSINRLSDFQ